MRKSLIFSVFLSSLWFLDHHLTQNITVSWLYFIFVLFYDSLVLSPLLVLLCLFKVSPTVSFLMTLMKATSQSLSGIQTCFLNKENKLSSGTLWVEIWKLQHVCLLLFDFYCMLCFYLLNQQFSPLSFVNQSKPFLCWNAFMSTNWNCPLNFSNNEFTHTN